MLALQKSLPRQSVIAPPVTPTPELVLAPDLVLGIGEFFVMPDGIHAVFASPLDRLSDFYAWETWPFGLIAARSLVTSDDSTVLSKISARLRLSITEMHLLNLQTDEMPASIEEQCLANIERGAQELIAWSANLAAQCPVPEAAQTLQRIAKMDNREADRFAAQYILVAMN